MATESKMVRLCDYAKSVGKKATEVRPFLGQVGVTYKTPLQGLPPRAIELLDNIFAPCKTMTVRLPLNAKPQFEFVGNWVPGDVKRVPRAMLREFKLWRMKMAVKKE